jgi:cytosine/adenosine deaminase-related metal-dependent hydrolase
MTGEDRGRRGRRGVLRFDAAAIVDETGVVASPGSLLIDTDPAQTQMASPSGQTRPSGLWRGVGVILAVGTPSEISAHPAAQTARTVPLASEASEAGGGAGRHVLLPGMVNAHTHLDLTAIGPRPYNPEQGFAGWIGMVRSERLADAEGIAHSVRRGIELSRSAGVVAIGDIAGAPRGRSSLIPARAMAAAGMPGVSFIEFFAIGRNIWNFQQWLGELFAEWERAGSSTNAWVRLGLQPHAPNTVDRRAYAWAFDYAAAMGRAIAGVNQALPIATHLAESVEEREFIAHARGPQCELLESLGLWHDSVLHEVGHGARPVEHLAPVLARRGDGRAGRRGPLLVHLNDLNDREIELLAQASDGGGANRGGPTVVYCPRASAYFGAERQFGPHRYRDLLRAGVRVALGTDSLINLPVEAGRTTDEGAGGEMGGRGMSVWDEARFLYGRDGTDPGALMRMATVSGAEALGMPPEMFRFEVGNKLAGLVQVEVTGSRGEEVLKSDPLAAALLSEAPARGAGV